MEIELRREISNALKKTENKLLVKLHILEKAE